MTDRLFAEHDGLGTVRLSAADAERYVATRFGSQ